MKIHIILIVKCNICNSSKLRVFSEVASRVTVDILLGTVQPLSVPPSRMLNVEDNTTGKANLLSEYLILFDFVLSGWIFPTCFEKG